MIRTPDNPSASSADRWLACPGSIGLSATLPKPPDTKWNLEGTRAHSVVDSILDVWQHHGRNLTAESLLSIKSIYGAIFPDEKVMVGNALHYVDICSLETESFQDPPVVKREMKVVLDADRKMTGRIDFGAFGYRQDIATAVIADFKYGQGVPVSAVNNAQTAYYAVACWRASTRDIKRVKAIICQPRRPDGYSEAWIDHQGLKDWYDRFLVGADLAMYQTKSGKLTFKAGHHCRFCPAKQVCQTYVDAGRPG